MTGSPEARPRLVDACRGAPVDRTPVWFMRQAGRSLPEYRRIREKHSLLDICRSPDLGTEVTLQPIRRFGMDGAIVFADILLPLVPMGIDLEFVPGVGPRIHNPVRSHEDVSALGPVVPEESLSATLSTIQSVRSELPDDVALIGFAGAPFTLASYLVEGGPTKTFAGVKSLMYREPDTFRQLMDKLVRITVDYLIAQARAGAQILQLFDSWVGFLNPEDYRRYVKPHTAAVFQSLRELDCPTIHFGVGAGALLEDLRDAGGDVIGLDWRLPLDESWARVGYDRGVQGNLDPTVLLGPPELIRERVDRILARAGGRPGHVFNLGHGVLPSTPTDGIRVAVEAVRAWPGVDPG